MAKADWCPRLAYWHLTRDPEAAERASFQREAIFQYGHDAHARWQRWLAEMNLLAGYWKCQRCGLRTYFNQSQGTAFDCSCGGSWVYDELPLDDPELLIAGSTDGYIPSRQCLIEIKTIGEGTVRFDNPELLVRHTYDTKKGPVVDLPGLWGGIHRPFDSHMRQGQLYLYLARKMGYDVDKIVFLYDSKLNQDAKEFSVDYDERPIKPLLSGAMNVAMAINHNAAVPTCIRGDEKCAGCRYYEEQDA